MCAQCMAAAATAGAAATGARVWLASRSPAWLTQRRLRVATGVLLASGVLVAGTQLTATPSLAEPSERSPVVEAPR